MNPPPSQLRTKIGAASLIVGPALMSIGDLMHPPESWDVPAQVAIIAADATHWYLAIFFCSSGFSFSSRGSWSSPGP